MFVEYFQHLFCSSIPSSEHIEAVLADTPKVVTTEMNQLLLGEFTKVEVVLALQQMSPLKAPSPDGMPPIFYQLYWGRIGDDVSKAVLSCHNSGVIPPNLNHTYITLVPKKIPEESLTSALLLYVMFYINLWLKC